MQILLANAKIMFDKADRAAVSKPLFQSVAEMLATEMAKLDVEELARQLDCSHKIASENWKRYRNFMAAEKMPAILSMQVMVSTLKTKKVTIFPISTVQN